MNYFTKSIIFLSLFFCMNGTQAQIDQRSEDLEGSPEDPLFSRYPGSVVEFFEQRVMEYNLVTGKIKWSPDLGVYQLKDKGLYGNVLRILYSTPKQNTTEMLYQFYLNNLEAHGFEILFSGIDEEEIGPAEKWFDLIFDKENGLNPLINAPVTLQGENPCYIAAQKIIPGGNDLYVSVFIEDDDLDWNYTLAMFDLIEVADERQEE